MYWEGKGTTINYRKSYESSLKAAHLGSARRLLLLGYIPLHGTPIVKQDWPLTVELLLLARKLKDQIANHELAFCYEHGITFNPELQKAWSRSLEAHEKLFLSAAASLARCYEEGIYVKKNHVEATKLYKYYATQHGEPHYRKCFLANHGMYLVMGLALEENRRLGFQLIREGMKSNCSQGWSVLGKMYQHGYGIARNPHNALLCFKRGSKAFDGAMASRRAGQIYMHRLRLQRNTFKSIEYLKQTSIQVSDIANLILRKEQIKLRLKDATSNKKR